MYNVIFSSGGRVDFGKCVVTSQTDTSMENFYTSTETGYTDFTALDVSVGEKLYIEVKGVVIFFARISAITASTITLSQNPGQVIHNEVLKNGFINPFVKRTSQVYSYRCDKYCGASLAKNGNTYYTYAEANPILSDATKTVSNSVIVLYFEKANNIESVFIKVKDGSAKTVIMDIVKAFRQEKDIDFEREKLDINKDIIGLESISSGTRTQLY